MSNSPDKTLGREKTLELHIGQLHGREGSAALARFLKELIQKYPDRAYGPGVVDELNPDRITYIANHRDHVAGMWDGIKDGKIFRGRLKLVDPKYQGTNVAKSLAEAMFADFEEARINVYPFGQKKGTTPEYFEARKRALVKYYERLGFVFDDDAKNPDKDVVPMVWQRSEQALKVYARIKSLVGDTDINIEEKAGEAAAMNAFEERMEFARQLQPKYRDTYDTYAAYHALIHSTPVYESMPGRNAVTRGDFPGEDSIERFLMDLRKKYNL